MTEHTPIDDEATRFCRELVTLVDAGLRPSAQDIASALGIDETLARNLINSMDEQGLLRGERYTDQGRPVRVTWLSDELRAEAEI